MKRTKIPWADATWNPITGCSPASDGCQNCYAARMAPRFAGRFGYDEKEPFKPGTVHWDKFMEPILTKKPANIFVCSMGDLFHEKVNIHDIDLVFSVMALTPHHNYMILTKRPERMKWYLRGEREHFKEEMESGSITSACIVDITRAVQNSDRQWRFFSAVPGWKTIVPDWPFVWPLPNVLVGTSIEDQRYSDRIIHLLQCPAVCRFVSIEPMIGPVTLANIHDDGWDIDALRGLYSRRIPETVDHPAEVEEYADDNRIDWVICGAETGQQKRPMNNDWAERLRKECQSAGKPFLFKQDSAGNKNLNGVVYEEFPAMLDPSRTVKETSDPPAPEYPQGNLFD